MNGYEIGNHTVGHAGGAAIGSFWGMEDELLAHNVPKPTTIAWPVYQVNTRTYPDLAANGYTFGRGGHFRPYRPTVDHPFDIPCLGGGNLEEFVKSVRQAAGGRIVVICFHGVPDGEHPAVGIEPATFKDMMQYLKDNNYRVIALRDLAEYIEPAKAVKLPPTASEFREPGPAPAIKDDKPFFAKDIRGFGFPGLSPATIFQSTINVTVPCATDITALTPQYSLSVLGVLSAGLKNPRTREATP